MAQPVDVFFMTDAKNATFKVHLPDGQMVLAKSNADGAIHMDVTTTVSQPSYELGRNALSSVVHHTEAFMANIAIDACAQAVVAPGPLPSSYVKKMTNRVIEVLGDNLIADRNPLWDTVVGSIAKAQPQFREIQEKVLRNTKNENLRVAKGVTFKHPTVLINFISHEFEFDIIPTAYSHNVQNGGDVILRFAGFNGGDFCQVALSNRRWLTIIGREENDEIHIQTIHYKTRDQIERRIKLSDMGFLQHIAEAWILALFSGKPQPHRNIELIMYDLQVPRHRVKNVNEGATVEKRYNHMLEKLKMLFDENTSTETDVTWVKCMREVYMGMGRDQGHVVSGRIIRITTP